MQGEKTALRISHANMDNNILRRMGAMKHILLPIRLLVCLCIVSSMFAGCKRRALYDEEDEVALLKTYIERKSQFDQEKEHRIAILESELLTSYDRYGVLRDLFDEYKSYNFDRAYACVEQLQAEAVRLGDKDKIVDAQVQQGFCYLSAGLFTEGVDLFEDMDTTGVSVRVKADYCITFARLMYDLASYDQIGLTHHYNERGNDLMREALTYYTQEDTLYYWNALALLDLHESAYDRAIKRFQIAIEDSRITNHDLAVVYSTIAFLQLQLGRPNEQLRYNIMAAIKDIESSTKEAIAMRNVAEILHHNGNLRDAALCIRAAQDDAIFYNARHRQVEISQILPIIEQENAHQLETQHKKIIALAVVIVVLLVICLCILRLLRQRNHKLQQAREIISQTNQNLKEANRIKEEYLGNLLSWQSDYINDMDRLQQFVRKQAAQHKSEDWLNIPKSMDVHRKREEFDKRFDEMFLKIFPNFVSQFNQLLRENEQIVLKEGELLNTDLRIFALMRLGITHNEVIAQILDYSVNTIYTYKTKIKNRSDLSNDCFMEAVMQISSYKD